MADRRSAIVAAIGLGCALLGAAWSGTPSGRSEVGHPVAGVVALIDASAPRGDIFNGQFCGGTLVAADQVMTAAHCVAGKSAGSLEVVVGADNLCRGRPIDGERAAVLGVTIHPRHDPATAAYDLALLRLERAPHSGVHGVGGVYAAAGDGQAAALGWGRASLGGVPACGLIRTQLKLVDADECAAVIGEVGIRRFDVASMLCARPALGTADTCLGDSGGPLFIGPDLDSAALIGVTSWGYGCGTTGPGVYARADAWPTRANLDSEQAPAVDSGGTPSAAPAAPGVPGDQTTQATRDDPTAMNLPIRARIVRTSPLSGVDGRSVPWSR